jgi:hypothetical protein
MNIKKTLKQEFGQNRGRLCMIDLKEVTKIVNELNDLECKKEGQSFDERLKLLENQGVLWQKLHACIGCIVCRWG